MTQTCPRCAEPIIADARFCEACGGAVTDLVTVAPEPETTVMLSPGSALERAKSVGLVVPPTIPVEWVAEVWVDPRWYEGQQTTHRCPAPGPPRTVALRVRSLLVGRRSVSRGTHPQIDCSEDPGVSRRHAQLTTDGKRWYVEDLGSSNGSFVASDATLPEVPIRPGERVEIAPGDRIYLGAWTRITVRSASRDERAG